ncbi:MAG: hypothetical protein AAF654_14825 [Myxococcota bacterium]
MGVLMPLSFQTVSVPFAQGVDTKSDPRQLPVGKLVELENGELDGINRISKRAGYTQIAQGVEINKLLAASGTVIGLGDFGGSQAGGVGVVSSALSGGVNVVGRTPSLSTQRVPLGAISDGQHWHAASGSSAVNGITYAVLVGNKLKVFQFDSGSPLQIFEQELAGSDFEYGVAVWFSPAITQSDAQFTVVYCRLVSSQFRYYARQYTGTTNTLSAEVDLSLSSPTRGLHYLQGANRSDQRMLCVNNDAIILNRTFVAGRFTGENFSAAAKLAVAGCVSVNVGTQSQALQDFWLANISVAETSPGSSTYEYRLRVSRSTGDGASWNTAFNEVISEQLGGAGLLAEPFQMVALPESRDPDAEAFVPRQVTLYIAVRSALHKVSVRIDGSTFSSTRSDVIGNLPANVLPSSKTQLYLPWQPFRRQGRDYLPVVFRSVDEETVPNSTFVALLDGETLDVVSNPIPQFLAEYDRLAPRPISTMVSNVQSVEAGIFRWHIPHYETLDSAGGGGQLVLSVFPHTFNDAHGAVAVDESTVLLGDAATRVFDGRSVRINTPLFLPDQISFVGSAQQTGQNVAIFYSYTDAAGRIHRGSPVFRPRTFAGSVSEAGFPDNLTDTDFSFEIYRTEQNGSLHYFLASAPVGTPIPEQSEIDGGTANEGFTRNSSNAPIDLPDTEIVARGVLYSDGQLDAFSPPPCQFAIFRLGNRILLATAQNTMWISKPIVPGVAVEFSPILTQAIPDATSIKAAVEMDGNGVLLSGEGIYRLTGPGFTANGTGPGFSVVRLNVDVGIEEKESLVVVPRGLMFRSSRGIELLTRGLELLYAGALIEEELVFIVGATVHPEKNQVRFYQQQSVLVFDYLIEQWGTFKLNTGGEFNFVQSAVEANGIDHLVALDGGFRTVGELSQDFVRSVDVYRESITVFTDDGRPYALRLKTGWIAPAGPQGLCKIRRFAILAERLGDHTLTVRVRYDYNDDVRQTVTFDTLTGIPAGDENYQFRARLDRMKCTAIQLEIESSAASTAELALSNLTMEVAALTGISRLGDGQSV